MPKERHHESRCCDDKRRRGNPSTSSRPRCRGKVQQLLASDDRGLVSHPGNLDDGVRGEIVSVVVRPPPELDQPGCAARNDEPKPRPSCPPSSKQCCDQPQHHEDRKRNWHHM